MSAIVFKEASDPDEIIQTQRLNHQTFVEELGQYGANPNGILVDRFHASNRYFLALDRDALIGMVSIHCDQPFSIESRLSDRKPLESLENPCEVRLLAVAPNARHSMVLAGLFWQVYAAATQQGNSHLLISGLKERSEMYCSLGFRELGPAVLSGAASYIPMSMDLQDRRVREKAERYGLWWGRRDAASTLSLLPGPVQIASSVRNAFLRAPISHRSSVAIAHYQEIRERLSAMLGGMQVALMAGSGTLANDIVAACLKQRFGDQRGIVLANGEFGDRLIRQAFRAGLQFTPIQSPWGEPWDHERVSNELHQGAKWIWCVHLETSTGQLNNVFYLSQQALANRVALAVDCVSSLGAVDCHDLNLLFASGVSGKAIGTYAGLGFVFASRVALEETCFDRMPASFDIRAAILQKEPLHTMPSPQLIALCEALRKYYSNPEASRRRFEGYALLGYMVRAKLRARGHRLLVNEDMAAPTICTFPLPDGGAERCLKAGFRVAYESSYLRRRNWCQIATMGDLDADRIEAVFDALGQAREAGCG